MRFIHHNSHDSSIMVIIFYIIMEEQVALDIRSEGSMQGALKVPRMSFIEAAASFVAPAAPPAASFVESSKDSDRGVEVRSHWEALGGSAQADGDRGG